MGTDLKSVPPCYSGDYSSRFLLLSIMYDFSNLALFPERRAVYAPDYPDTGAIY
jgi:hypothetical protein